MAYYKLVKKKVEPCSLAECEVGKLIRRSVFTVNKWHVEISTVFLGLDHNYGGPKPVLFETMAFSLHENVGGAQSRYSSYDRAVEGHNNMIKSVRIFLAGTSPPNGIGKLKKRKNLKTTDLSNHENTVLPHEET